MYTQNDTCKLKPPEKGARWRERKIFDLLKKHTIEDSKSTPHYVKLQAKVLKIDRLNAG